SFQLAQSSSLRSAATSCGCLAFRAYPRPNRSASTSKGRSKVCSKQSVHPVRGATHHVHTYGVPLLKARRFREEPLRGHVAYSSDGCASEQFFLRQNGTEALI